MARMYSARGNNYPAHLVSHKGVASVLFQPLESTRLKESRNQVVSSYTFVTTADYLRRLSLDSLASRDRLSSWLTLSRRIHCS